MSLKTRRRIWLLIPIVVLALIVVILHVTGGFDALRKIVKSSRSFPDITDEDIRAAFTEMAEENPEAKDYLDGFTGITEYDLEIDLTDELTADEIPYYTQWDGRWGYCQYGSGLIGYTGCGPTALSMVAMGLTGDGTLTPAYMADLAIKNGYCVPGSGTSWTFFTQGAELVGLTAKELVLWEGTMRAELDAGRPIICVMGPGHFTDTGHYIVITGCTDDGFQVYDPFRPSNCKTWSYDDISGEIKNLWSYEVK